MRPAVEPAPQSHAQEAGSEPKPLDWVSVAALISGLLGVIFLALIFGANGLRRTGDGQRRGRRLAITGMALVPVWLLVAGATYLHNAGSTGKNGEQRGTALQLMVGDCLDAPAPGYMANVTDLTIQWRDCSKPHEAEVIWAGRVTSQTFEQFSVDVQSACDQQVADFFTSLGVNKPAGALAIPQYPGPLFWQYEGWVKCVMVSPEPHAGTAHEFYGR